MDKELENTGKKIRRIAKRNQLTAASRTLADGYGNRWRRWWFSDLFTNLLESPEIGLADDEAIDWLING